MREVSGETLIVKAFTNLMNTQPYSNLPNGVSFPLKKGLYLIKGKSGFYGKPDSLPTSPCDKVFALFMDYQIYLLTDCVIVVSFTELISKIKVK